MDEDLAGWHESQLERDSTSRRLSLTLLGAERAVFEEAMAAILEYINASTYQPPIKELALRRKVALTNFGFDLLLSSWEAALSGRYSVAVSLWRSISEAAQHMMALQANPHLAQEMGKEGTTVKIETIRRSIRDNLDKLDAGAGTRWITQRMQSDKTLQPLAHVTTESVGAALAVLSNGSAKIGLLRPGGIVSAVSLRPIAIYIADSALDLQLASVVALQEFPGILELWEPAGRRRCEALIGMLDQALNEIRVPYGDLERIVLLRFGQEPEQIADFA